MFLGQRSVLGVLPEVLHLGFCFWEIDLSPGPETH